MRFFAIFLLIISFSFASFKNLRTFQADFKQILVNDQNDTITYTGKIYADRNEKALWIYETPVSKKIYYNKNLVVIIEPELEQAIFSKLKQVPNILNILQKAKKIKPNVYVARCCKKSFWIYLKRGVISKITYKDKMQNRVTILFFNQKVNRKIPAKTFKYHIPKGYDLLKD
ncbi:MAG: outer membrane lipoprotein chaperone LolA [Epsilonproteobacteria bacterium]|nr:outer membrane lipoprotein chaperone LolA [Campylobacterota bacterium]